MSEGGIKINVGSRCALPTYIHTFNPSCAFNDPQGKKCFSGKVLTLKNLSVYISESPATNCKGKGGETTVFVNDR
jgi:hypothetical protein